MTTTPGNGHMVSCNWLQKNSISTSPVQYQYCGEVGWAPPSEILSVLMSASRVLSDIIFCMCRIFTNKESNCENCLHQLAITSKLVILRRDIYVQIHS